MATAAAQGSQPPPLGRFCEVGGRRLLMHRSGDGGPSIVFLPGAGTVGLDYFNVQQLGARLATSILYDRAGTGWSERVAMPRTAAQVTDELRELLAAADAPRPYLLVGHSLGGLYARHFAQRFPEEVAGLLLLDPAHEDYDAYMPPRLDAAGRARPDKPPNAVIAIATARAAAWRCGYSPARFATASPGASWGARRPSGAIASFIATCSRKRWPIGRGRCGTCWSSAMSASTGWWWVLRKPRTCIGSTTRFAPPDRCRTCL